MAYNDLFPTHHLKTIAISDHIIILSPILLIKVTKYLQDLLETPLKNNWHG